MTWSLVNTITTQATSLDKAQLSAPFDYFYETFLPSRGWTVTAGEFAGNAVASQESAWGLSKAFTFADGYTAIRNVIHEVEFSTGDMNVWDWTGSPGTGLGLQIFVDSSWSHGLRTGINNYLSLIHI